jgi:phosphoketolase
MTTGPLTPELLDQMDAYWRAANYLSLGQRYLYNNPLLQEPLKLLHVKPMVLGHRGTTPGQNFIYVHLNRVLNDLDRFHLVQDAVDRLPHLGTKGACLKQLVQDKLIGHKHYIAKHGQDLPEIRNWMWQG